MRNFNYLIKNVIVLFVTVLTLNSYDAYSQEIVNGPGIENQKNIPMTKVLDGDDSCFYAYRLKQKASDPYCIIEKYNKTTLKQIYSYNIEFNTEDNIENIIIANKHPFIFFKRFNDDEKTISIYVREMKRRISNRDASFVSMTYYI